MIEKEISAMPPGMRKVYELRSKQYMSAKDISEHLGVAESTVNTQLKRAMKHLKLKLWPCYLCHFYSELLIRKKNIFISCPYLVFLSCLCLQWAGILNSN